MSWKCQCCGQETDGIPICFGSAAPWELFVPDEEFATRVLLDDSCMVIDHEKHFVRGEIEIPVHGLAMPFRYSVWASVSEESMNHMFDRWEDQDRANDAPYFGWLLTSLPLYPDTMHLKLSIQSREVGIVPVFTIEPSEHPLALEQKLGITVERWHQIARHVSELAANPPLIPPPAIPERWLCRSCGEMCEPVDVNSWSCDARRPW